MRLSRNIFFFRRLKYRQALMHSDECVNNDKLGLAGENFLWDKMSRLPISLIGLPR